MHMARIHLSFGVVLLSSTPTTGGRGGRWESDRGRQNQTSQVPIPPCPHGELEIWGKLTHGFLIFTRGLITKWINVASTLSTGVNAGHGAHKGYRKSPSPGL